MVKMSGQHSFFPCLIRSLLHQRQRGALLDNLANARRFRLARWFGEVMTCTEGTSGVES